MKSLRSLKFDHDIALILLVVGVAVAGLYFSIISVSINETPKEYIVIEYLDETQFTDIINNEFGSALTGMAAAVDETEKAPSEIRSMMENEPPSHFRYRTYYGCYKRCVCSGAMTCKCMPGGCIKRN